MDMTAHTPDVLASVLPTGMSKRTGNGDVFWDTARVAQFQAERLAEAGYVLVHTAPDEATVERLAEVFRDAWHAADERGEAGQRVTHGLEAVLTALADTSTQARRTAPDEAMVERLAEAVHDAYLDTCQRLGWSVKPENTVPYAELSDDSQELDRATVRAVLTALTGTPTENDMETAVMTASRERGAT